MREILLIVMGGSERDTSLGVVRSNKRDTPDRVGVTLEDSSLVLLVGRNKRGTRDRSGRK